MLAVYPLSVLVKVISLFCNFAFRFVFFVEFNESVNVLPGDTFRVCRSGLILFPVRLVVIESFGFDVNSFAFDFTGIPFVYASHIPSMSFESSGSVIGFFCMFSKSCAVLRPTEFRYVRRFGGRVFVRLFGSGAKRKFWSGVRNEKEPFVSPPNVGSFVKSMGLRFCIGRRIWLIVPGMKEREPEAGALVVGDGVEESGEDSGV